jgi:cellulase (glycosyl hydrolase family 5)
VGRLAAIAASAVLCLVVAACEGGSADPSTPSVPTTPTTSPTPDAMPEVVVDGDRFVDKKGRTVRLRGVNVHSLEPAVYQRAHEIGANLIRVTVPWDQFEPTAPVDGVRGWDESRLEALDQLVAYCRQYGIQVLLDLHQYGWSPYFSHLQLGGRANGIPRWFYTGRRFAPTDEGRLLAQSRFYGDPRGIELYSGFAAMLAERYLRSPNVLGYEILNEPQVGVMPRKPWVAKRVLRWQGRILGAIRPIDPVRTVFFMVPPRIDLRQIDLSPLGSAGGLAYDFHDYYAGTGERGRTTLQGGAYEGTAFAQQAHLEPPVAAAKRWGVPMIVGEWGVFADAPGADAYQHQMVALFESVGAGWARWSLDRRERLSLLGFDGELNSAGLQLRELISRLR